MQFKSLDHKISLLQLQQSAIARLNLRREDIDYLKLSDVEMRLDCGLIYSSMKCYTSMEEINTSDDDIVGGIKSQWLKY